MGRGFNREKYQNDTNKAFAALKHIRQYGLELMKEFGIAAAAAKNTGIKKPPK
jgi:hypothetical protein